jgi:hypothetical protein
LAAPQEALSSVNKQVDVNEIYTLYYQNASKSFKRLFSFFERLSSSGSIKFLTYLCLVAVLYTPTGLETRLHHQSVTCAVSSVESNQTLFQTYLPHSFPVGYSNTLNKGLLLPKVVCAKYDVTWFVRQMAYYSFLYGTVWGTMLLARRSRVPSSRTVVLGSTRPV